VHVKTGRSVLYSQRPQTARLWLTLTPRSSKQDFRAARLRGKNVLTQNTRPPLHICLQKYDQTEGLEQTKPSRSMIKRRSNCALLGNEHSTREIVKENWRGEDDAWSNTDGTGEPYSAVCWSDSLVSIRWRRQDWILDKIYSLITSSSFLFFSSLFIHD
jgi:hypothetical protein